MLNRIYSYAGAGMKTIWNSLSNEMRVTIIVQVVAAIFMLGMGYMGYLTFASEVEQVSDRQEEMRTEIYDLQRRVDDIEFIKKRLDSIEENQKTIRKLLIKYTKSNGEK